MHALSAAASEIPTTLTHCQQPGSARTQHVPAKRAPRPLNHVQHVRLQAQRRAQHLVQKDELIQRRDGYGPAAHAMRSAQSTHLKYTLEQRCASCAMQVHVQGNLITQEAVLALLLTMHCLLQEARAEHVPLAQAMPRRCACSAPLLSKAASQAVTARTHACPQTPAAATRRRASAAHPSRWRQPCMWPSLPPARPRPRRSRHPAPQG